MLGVAGSYPTERTSRTCVRWVRPRLSAPDSPTSTRCRWVRCGFTYGRKETDTRRWSRLRSGAPPSGRVMKAPHRAFKDPPRTDAGSNGLSPTLEVDRGGATSVPDRALAKRGRAAVTSLKDGVERASN